MKRFFRIHGDNIVECERTLNIIAKVFETEPILNKKSTLYKPLYDIVLQNNLKYNIELLSGHNRWGVDISEHILERGGLLREGADSYFTEITEDGEKILFALEYCSALPAGNNAWQRNGRAFATAMAGIPYFYFAEIGGAELDGDRTMKAPRFPNPIVPFSYIMLSKRLGNICMPVYSPHPSITEDVFKKYQTAFGADIAHQIIKDIIIGENYSTTFQQLETKAINMILILSDSRKSIDTLREKEWIQMLKSNNQAKWLCEKPSLIWKKKIADKISVTRSFSRLFETTLSLNCNTLGARDLPFCLLAGQNKELFIKTLKNIYKKIKFTFSQKPLAVIWINGFKPKGDDARPDRGLPPLVKMLLGDSADILTIVFGPGFKSNWEMLKESPDTLANNNGLWQSVLRISDFVLADSATCDAPIFYTPRKTTNNTEKNIYLKQKNVDFVFSEHDTDTAIHQIFTKNSTFRLLECLCNPPGGDWSGISYFDSKAEYRWTSLPRVSNAGGKRPDHIFQVKESSKKNILLSIESKKNGSDLENHVGKNLKVYIDDLFMLLPSAYRTEKNDWRLFDQQSLKIEKYQILSVGAFEYKNEDELKKLLNDKELDAVFAFEFGETTTFHLLTTSKNISNIVKKAASGINGLIVKIH